MAEDFTAIPIVDYSLSTSPVTRPQFLSQLRDALVKVGFFYLQNHPIPQCVQRDFIYQSVKLFDLPSERKNAIDMVNSKHFVGYVGLDQSTTSENLDFRETYTLGYECPAPGPDDPLYHNLRGPNLWPEATLLPGFRPAMEQYMAEVKQLTDEFKRFIAEALDLDPLAVSGLFDEKPFDRLMLAKYCKPSPLGLRAGKGSEGAEAQGKGVHKDSSYLTFLLPGTSHRGLEAMNPAGEWIPVPPVPGAMIINVGMQLEALTDGVCNAAVHRVVVREQDFVDSAGHELGPRYSFPLFHTVSLDLSPGTSLQIPPHIAALVKDNKARQNARLYLRRLFQRGCAGNGIFATRLGVYRKVAQRWWPEQLEKHLEEAEAKR